MNFTDFQNQRKLLCMSTNLQNVATGLKKKIQKKPLSEEDKKYIEYAQNLVGQIDWDSKNYNAGNSRKLSVIATELRAKFYRLARQNEISPKEVYEVLESKNKKGLNQVYEIFQSMSNSLLTKLNETIPIEKL